VHATNEHEQKTIYSFKHLKEKAQENDLSIFGSLTIP
jgi:hypothetical protein